MTQLQIPADRFYAEIASLREDSARANRRLEKSLDTIREMVKDMGQKNKYELEQMGREIE